MAVNVTFGAARINILDADDNLISTVAYQTVDTISPVVNPNTVVTSTTLGGEPVVTDSPQWSLVFWVRDKRVGAIQLGSVLNQPDWTNDQDGFDQAVADIYAAFNT